MLGQTFAILVITLALDFVLLATVFSGLKRDWADAASAYAQAYIYTAYHHDLAPNVKSTRVWGNIVYSWQTDRYGFRIGACAPGETEKDRPAIFVIGDSFVEAIGSSYEKSFVGLMACDAAKQGEAVWNLGVASYSPVIYHRKIRAAAQRLGIKPAEIYVFLDLSDIGDDANIYRVGEDGVVRSTSFHWFEIGQFLLDNFATFRLGYDLYLSSSFSTAIGLGRERARWALDPASHGGVGPAWTGTCGQQSRPDRRHLPGMGLPRNPRRLSVAGKCRGWGPGQHSGDTLAGMGCLSQCPLCRRFCPLSSANQPNQRCANISSPVMYTLPNSDIECFLTR